MTGRKITFLILQSKIRRILRNADSPIDRALALVALARTIDAQAAEAAVKHPGPHTHFELQGTHHILAATLEHLRALSAQPPP